MVFIVYKHHFRVILLSIYKYISFELEIISLSLYQLILLVAHHQIFIKYLDIKFFELWAKDMKFKNLN